MGLQIRGAAIPPPIRTPTLELHLARYAGYR